MNHSNLSLIRHQPRPRFAIAQDEQPDPLPQLMHQHAYLHEVTLIVSGTALCTIDHERYHAAAGDVIFCRAGARHTLTPHGDGICYRTILFDDAPNGLALDALLPACVYHCGDAMPSLLPLARLLCADAAHQTPAVQSHLLIALLLQISACGISAAPVHTIDKAAPAYAMSSFIDQHYGEEIFLGDIAGSVGITASHAIHVYKPVFGTSPVQHLNSRRIGQAQSSLLTTKLSASQIASEVGIGNINYFYTVFKKLVGMSPTSYRAHFEGRVHRSPPEPAIF